MARAPPAVLQVNFPPSGSRRKAPQDCLLDAWHNDMEVCLVFFSTFEELKLPATGPMDRASATTKLYEPSPTPILYVASCDLMLGRVPLFPCFMHGNATPTIPHKLRHLKGSAFQYGTGGPPTQPPLMAVGGATCMRSTCGCGSLDEGGLAWRGCS